MERLTRHGVPDYENILWSGKDENKIVIKLAAYEDTGLTPEKINEHEEIFKAYRHVCGGKSPQEINNLLEDRIYWEKEASKSARELGEMKGIQEECEYWHREAIKWAGKLGEHRIKFRKLLNDFGIPECDFPDNELEQFLFSTRQQDSEVGA